MKTKKSIKYQLNEVIGKGAMGTVYLAENPETRETVAVKKLNLNPESKDIESILRFKREAKIITKLNHPNIIKLLNFVEQQDSIFIVMEYFNGKDLKKINPDLTLKDKIQIMLSIAETLDYIHTNDIIHRDIKPQNILYHKNGCLQVKIIDFGLSYLNDFNDQFKKGSMIGSFSYMSPEQTGFLRRSIDARSDLYSLGATFYELLTQSPPFKETEASKLIHKHLSAIPAKPSSLNPEIPNVLDDIILKLLSKEPEERYQSAAGLASDLKFFLENPEIPSFKIGHYDRNAKINFQLKMIGRDNEENRLQQAYQNSLTHNTEMILIKGKSGTGKTKLVNTFLEKINQEQSQICLYQSTAKQSNVPFAALGELLKSIFEKKSTQPQFIQKIKETDQIQAIFSIFPALRAFIGNSPAPQNKKLKKDQIHDAFYELFLTLGQLNQHFVFILDDIQWTDQDSIDVLQYLSQCLKNAKLLFVLIFREEDTPPLNTSKLLENHVATISLSVLSKHDIKRFVNRMLNIKTNLAETFYDKIMTSTLGNAFFIMEMVKKLFEDRIIFNQMDQWQVDYALLEDFSFDNDVSKLLLKSLENFKDPLELMVLSVAAVIGKDFTLSLLEKVLREALKNEPEQLEKISLEYIIQVIDKARRNQLIRNEFAKEKGRYSFIHDKIKETLNLKIQESELKKLHQACAEVLEESENRHDNELIYNIAYHYNHTDCLSKILYYNDLAYKNAEERHSINEAVYYMQKYIDSLFLFDFIDEDSIIFLSQMALYMLRVGKSALALDYLNRGLIIAQERHYPLGEMKVIIQLGTSYYFLNQTAKAITYYQQAMDLSKQIKTQIEDPFLYRMLGASLFFSFEIDQSIDYIHKAIGFMDQDDFDNLVGAYGLLGWNYAFLGETHELREVLESMDYYLKKIKDPIILSHAYHLASVSYSLGNIDVKKALQYSLTASDLAKKSGYKLFEYSAYASRMWAYYYQNDFDAAEEAIQRAFDLSRENNHFIGIELYQSKLAECYLFQNKIPLAYETALKYLKEMQGPPKRYARMILLKVIACCYFIEGRLDLAHSIIDEALSIYQETTINLLGIELLFLKNQFFASQDQNSPEIDSQLEKIKNKYLGVEVLFSRSEQMIQMLLKLKENYIKPDKMNSTASGSIIKDSLQLENIIKTSQVISSILDIDELITKTMEKTVEVTGAERGTLILIDPETRALSYKIYHNIKNTQDFTVVPEIIEKILSTKKGMVYSSLSTPNFSVSNSMNLRNIKSIICAPLITKDQIIGILYLDSQLINNLFKEEDLEILSVFTSQVAISLENARLHEKMLLNARIEQEMKIATDIQTSILPAVQDTEHYEIAAYMRTASEVGGDYYDLFLKEEPFFGVFGDVSGHGLKSGLIMLMAEVAFNMMVSDQNIRQQPLPQLYNKMNQVLFENMQERLSQKSELGKQYSSMYMTLRLFRFNNNGQFEMFGNDHAEPFICKTKENLIQTIPSTGFLLGILPEASMGASGQVFELESGDTLVCYSDGITEAKDAPKEKLHRSEIKRHLYGEKKLHELVLQHKNASPAQLIQRIIADVDRYMHTQDDDITLLVIKKK